jgi:hypothetical protein
MYAQIVSNFDKSNLKEFNSVSINLSLLKSILKSLFRTFGCKLSLYVEIIEISNQNYKSKTKKFMKITASEQTSPQLAIHLN